MSGLSVAPTLPSASFLWPTVLAGLHLDAPDRPDLVGRLDVRRDQMRAAAVDWEVPESGWRPLATGLALPDPNDVHVLAAAIAGHADCIVTPNLADFPPAALVPHGLERIHPDEFIVAQIDLDLVSTLPAFRAMRARRRNPQNTPLEFAAALERNGLVQTADRLRACAALI